MVYGAAVRSEYSHARIVSIDIPKAEKLPGVLKIVTAADIPGAYAGQKNFRSAGCLEDEVKNFGDVVAIVVAESLEAARSAAKNVSVVYEPLEPLTDAGIEGDGTRVPACSQEHDKQYFESL